MNKIVILDLDDTLCNIDQRKKYYGVDWDKYEAGIKDDKLNKRVYDYIRYHYPHSLVIILTGRYPSARELTEKWLRDNNIDYGILLMKPEGDNRSSVEFKKEWLAKYTKFVRENLLHSELVVFDDRYEIEQWCINNNVKYKNPANI